MPKRINHIAEKIYDIDNINFADKQAKDFLINLTANLISENII